MPKKGWNRKYDYNAVLEYIIRHKRENDGNSPGIRQIVNACNLGSTSVAAYILDTLEAQGSITRTSDVHGIIVTGGQWSYQP